ncbi:hypothetical protein [Myxococcus sp. CA027]|uniref:hypothetical protein n=1 Tax=Myxococcus TaxID=32 RepID=UPI00272BF09B|nr:MULTISPECIES: hypothetical protein [unclassified Myxococcus]
MSKEADASARMAEVNEANTVLSDPEKRAAYDDLGQESARCRSGAGGGQDFRPPPNWDAGFEFSDHGDSQGMDSAAFSDFFEQMFGRAARAQRGAGAGSAGAGGNFRSGPPPSQRGEDHHARCGGRRRVLANVKGAPGERAIVEHLGMPTACARLAAARGPPQAVWC